MEWYSNHVAGAVKSGAPGRTGDEGRFPRRQARARRTRRSVIDAARRSFVAGGYGATTMNAIAEEAGVAVQTVYATFGNKPAILAAVLDVAIAGDDDAVPVNDRAWMAPVFSAPTAEQRLRAYAAAVRRIHHGAGEVFAVLAQAAGSDPEVARLHDAAEARRRTGAASVVAAVEEVAPLRPGLSTRRAVDLVWLWNGPLVHDHLTVAAGWPDDDYETWLADTMVGELLAAPD